MKNIFKTFIIFTLILGSFSLTPLCAADTSSTTNEIIADTVPVSEWIGKILVVSMIIIKLIGILIVTWGIHMTFVEVDQRNEGLKMNGMLKIFGGAALLMLGNIIKWLIGS